MKRIVYCAVALIMFVMNGLNGFAASKTDGCSPDGCCRLGKALVLYYSQGGNTLAVAQELQQRLNADIEAIELIYPYSASYDETLERCREEREKGIIPEVKPLKTDLSKYDIVFLGYPIWFGTYALPISGLLQNEKFEGKVVVPFCTFGSGGLESSAANLKEALPQAVVTPGYGVRTVRLKSMPAELNRFLIEQGYVAGKIEPLPDYSEPTEVTADDVAIFTAACSSYKFPLGTPKTVGKRVTSDSTDYRFTAVSTMPNGEPAEFTIYVTVGNQPGSVAEFTKVVR